MILANLCVSYIMTSHNEEAEEWMRSIEREEEKAAKQNPDKQTLHLCIVNLVIGTLYCSKGHYEFGISRVIKSLEPFNKKIMPDTWYYAKRCFLFLLETLAKHLLMVKDETISEILLFLDAACTFGKNIKAYGQNKTFGLLENSGKDERNTVAYEARLLKRLCLKLRE